MKRRIVQPFIWLFAFVMIVGMACQVGGGSEPTAAPTQAPVEQPAEQEPTEAPATEAPTAAPAVEETNSVKDLKGVKNAVIQIEAQGTFIDPEYGYVPNAAGRGSGFIIDPSGIAVTNNHVVTGAGLFKVWLGGDQSKTYNAKVLGVSECSDLAVIDLEGNDFPYLDWSDLPIEVGQEIYVAGFPLGDPEYSLTKGIISKSNAGGETNWSSVDAVISYDATTNPGNSGGPVVDPEGKVMAVHYAGNPDTDQAFGISRDVAEPVIEELSTGKNLDTVGINGTAVSSDDGSVTGIWVSSVQSGSPADKAGIAPGDLLLTLENLDLATDGTMADYCDILRSHDPGDTLSVIVFRPGTGEILEGQLNGRELAVTGTLDTSGSSDSGQSGTSTSEVNTEASASGEIYYDETFDNDISNTWEYFLTSGNDSALSQTLEDGKLVVEISEPDTYTYFMFKDWTFTDPRLDVKAINRGVNTNYVGLVCRLSDQGWYEVNILSSGVYYFYYVDPDYNYTKLWDGGSRLVKTGNATNDYTLICNGDTLTLGINGTEVKSIKLTGGSYPILTDGQVGITVSSTNSTPVVVDFEEFVISVP
jgi:S1-C subfamily serine protease